MRQCLIITVNGRRRRTVVLAAPQPIPNLELLALDFGSSRGPHFLASRDDYRRGAYRFHPSTIRIGPPGTYRPRAVAIRYTDGTSAESPLLDTILIEVAAIPKRPEHLPLFTAR
jgi:hypothetical protein